MTERQRAEKLLSKSVEEKEVLLRELQHRVKNSLGIVSCFLRLNMSSLEDERSIRVFQEAVDRISCVSMVYEKLSVSTSIDQVDLGKYLGDLVELLRSTYAAGTEKLSLVSRLARTLCDMKRAVSLGLMLNELFTNALKYAYKPGEAGEIRIDLSSDGERTTLKVSDDGPGLPRGFDPKSAKSLGLRIARLLAEEIGGSLEFEAGKGTAAVVVFDHAKQ